MLLSTCIGSSQTEATTPISGSFPFIFASRWADTRHRTMDWSVGRTSWMFSVVCLLLVWFEHNPVARAASLPRRLSPLNDSFAEQLATTSSSPAVTSVSTTQAVGGAQENEAEDEEEEPATSLPSTRVFGRNKGVYRNVVMITQSPPTARRTLPSIIPATTKSTLNVSTHRHAATSTPTSVVAGEAEKEDDNDDEEEPNVGDVDVVVVPSTTRKVWAWRTAKASITTPMSTSTTTVESRDEEDRPDEPEKQDTRQPSELGSGRESPTARTKIAKLATSPADQGSLSTTFATLGTSPMTPLTSTLPSPSDTSRDAARLRTFGAPKTTSRMSGVKASEMVVEDDQEEEAEKDGENIALTLTTIPPTASRADSIATTSTKFSTTTNTSPTVAKTFATTAARKNNSTSNKWAAMKAKTSFTTTQMEDEEEEQDEETAQAFESSTIPTAEAVMSTLSNAPADARSTKEARTSPSTLRPLIQTKPAHITNVSIVSATSGRRGQPQNPTSASAPLVALIHGTTPVENDEEDSSNKTSDKTDVTTANTAAVTSAEEEEQDEEAQVDAVKDHVQRTGRELQTGAQDQPLSNTRKFVNNHKNNRTLTALIKIKPSTGSSSINVSTGPSSSTSSSAAASTSARPGRDDKLAQSTAVAWEKVSALKEGNPLPKFPTTTARITTTTLVRANLTSGPPSSATKVPPVKRNFEGAVGDQADGGKMAAVNEPSAGGRTSKKVELENEEQQEEEGEDQVAETVQLQMRTTTAGASGTGVVDWRTKWAMWRESRRTTAGRTSSKSSAESDEEEEEEEEEANDDNPSSVALPFSSSQATTNALKTSTSRSQEKSAKTTSRPASTTMWTSASDAVKQQSNSISIQPTITTYQNATKNPPGKRSFDKDESNEYSSNNISPLSSSNQLIESVILVEDKQESNHDQDQVGSENLTTSKPSTAFPDWRSPQKTTGSYTPPIVHRLRMADKQPQEVHNKPLLQPSSFNVSVSTDSLENGTTRPLVPTNMTTLTAIQYDEEEGANTDVKAATFLDPTSTRSVDKIATSMVTTSPSTKSPYQATSTTVKLSGELLFGGQEDGEQEEDEEDEGKLQSNIATTTLMPLSSARSTYRSRETPRTVTITAISTSSAAAGETWTLPREARFDPVDDRYTSK